MVKERFYSDYQFVGTGSGTIRIFLNQITAMPDSVWNVCNLNFSEAVFCERKLQTIQTVRKCWAFLLRWQCMHSCCSRKRKKLLDFYLMKPSTAISRSKRASHISERNTFRIERHRVEISTVTYETVERLIVGEWAHVRLLSCVCLWTSDWLPSKLILSLPRIRMMAISNAASFCQRAAHAETHNTC